MKDFESQNKITFCGIQTLTDSKQSLVPAYGGTRDIFLLSRLAE